LIIKKKENKLENAEIIKQLKSDLDGHSELFDLDYLTSFELMERINDRRELDRLVAEEAGSLRFF